MTYFKTNLNKSWSYISHNQVLSAVMAAMIGAVIFGAFDTTYGSLTKKSPPAPVEQAVMSEGIWGPPRPLFRCRPSGQCIAPDHVVFDSIANDPRVGNEAYFMEAKVLGSPYSMQSKVSVKVGDTVLVRANIENDAAMNVVHNQSLAAHDTRFNISLPTNSSSELPLIGHISATNAAPRRIYDTIFLHSKERFAIEYGWRSAVLANHMHKGLPLSDNIVGEGALIGSSSPNGIFPPGLFNNAAVFFLVHILPPTD